MRLINADYLKEHLAACAMNGRPLHSIFAELTEVLDAIDEVPTVTADEDTVSRQAVYDTLTEYYHHSTDIQHKALTEALSRVPPSPSRPQEQRYGYWMRMSDLNESEDDRYKCSCCGNVVHHRNKVFLYTYNSWCGACGADMSSKNAHGAWRIHATEGGAV